MKKWLIDNKALFQSNKFKLGALIAFIILVIGIIVGPKFFGYVMTVAVFTAFYFFSKQAEQEKILSPADLKNIKADIQAVEEEMAFIREHLEENPSDLDAKLLLRDLEQELEVIQSILPKNTEKN